MDSVNGNGLRTAPSMGVSLPKAAAMDWKHGGPGTAAHSRWAAFGHALRGIWERLERLQYTPETYPSYMRRCGIHVGQGCRIAAFGIEAGIEPYLLKIGDRVTIERGVACVTHDGAAWIFRHIVPDVQVYGPIVIEDDCYIGALAILCPGVRIGRKARVAPGSVVIGDIPPGVLVAGVPARQCNSFR